MSISQSILPVAIKNGGYSKLLKPIPIAAATVLTSSTLHSNDTFEREKLSDNSILPDLNGPAEKKKAERWLALMTLGNAGIATVTAQAPTAGSWILTSVEAAYAMHIFNNIYKFNIDETLFKTLLVTYVAKSLGTKLFSETSRHIAAFFP